MKSVIAEKEKLTLATYPVGPPDKNPLFFEKRVYQGSCGKVYPIPFIDKVYDAPQDKTYASVRLENDYVRLVLLPEIGGRIYIGQDKTNHDYNFFYKNDVIKPALVGLAGPWLSGGVEFNWPQHHRPGTFMPTDATIEAEPDGARTVWMSEHDPLNRLKGMHGIRIKPNSALIELRARLYNRTALTQTFLWWANVAVKVHEHYQSFFPPDVTYVADHAVRAMSSFPEAHNVYYGIDYRNRPGKNDLSRYTNIPVPTSYMVCRTEYDFFGGYDADARGGFVHVADRHICPGKKQWTWGNAEFGWAWDRELTDANGPYVELMAGVYTDNQPDFAYLMPYETKTFSQYWWSYKNLGPVQNANIKAAVRCVIAEDGRMDLGVAVPQTIENARIVLTDRDRTVLDVRATVSPDAPWQNRDLRFDGQTVTALKLSVFDAGRPVIEFRPVHRSSNEPLPEPASEPPAPEAVPTVEELYLTGEHLELYRHPTREPEIYWKQALRRDPQDSRSNIAMGRLALYRGQFDLAADFLETAIVRLTRRHPNPVTTEAHYFLGLTRKFQGRFHDAYEAFHQSIWNEPYRAAGYYELACLDVRRGDDEAALDHIEQGLICNADNNKAIVLKSVILHHLHADDAAQSELEALLRKDCLDHWALFELGSIRRNHETFLKKSRNDAQTILDIAFDYADGGFASRAIEVLTLHLDNKVADSAVPNPLRHSPMVHYGLAWLYHVLGDEDQAGQILKAARSLSPDYFFPSRLQEQIVLKWAVSVDHRDRNAAYALGNYLFDRKRHEEAIEAWEGAQNADANFATVRRNLGMAYWNVHRDGQASLRAYQSAMRIDPADARIVYEYDQLRKILQHDKAARLAWLLQRIDRVLERDDCTVELATLYNETGQPEKALALLRSRRFHPWEGGEGKVLRQYTAARLLLGQADLRQGDVASALTHFHSAMTVPDNLGEAYHPLQPKADVNYWTGVALQALGDADHARRHFMLSAEQRVDFHDDAAAEHPDIFYYKGLSLLKLGREDEARRLFNDLKAYAENQMTLPAKIDYFATSLPNLLVIEEDLDQTHQARAEHWRSLAEKGLQGMTESSSASSQVRARPANAGEADRPAFLPDGPNP